MHTVSYKEEGAVVGKGCFPQASSIPCWNGVGSQMMTGGSCNSIKTSFVDQSDANANGLLQQLQSENEGLNMGMMRMRFFSGQSGYDGTLGNDQHHQHPLVTSALDSNSPEYLVLRTQLELGHSIARTAYPCSDPCYGSILATYGAQAVIHPHMIGLQQARIPLPSDALKDELVFVNAKQYHGILRRRKSRAKAEIENKVPRVRKQYLHESRHRHAMRRPRGCGGRFLNTKKLEELQGNAENGKLSEGQHEQSLSSSGSETLNSENGNTSSAQEAQGNSAFSGSEVTSLSQSSTDGTSYQYSQGSVTYLNHHPSSQFQLLEFPPFSDGSDEVVSGHGVGYPTKWIAAESCCGPMKV
uniref:Nuclear transcription factor Y subunit n=1 Tax=Araucaria cunninghamii TaxID=56994 RepID=A0A0D6QWS4_ARACU